MRQSGAELVQARLKLELERSYISFNICCIELPNTSHSTSGPKVHINLGHSVGLGV